ncbi:MAG: 50S ribosomal protein L25 [Planctomycetota bacterium]|nr:MAG: 50S ribosomal protein L25 [Planctomycetota bacterium]RKY13176.1 MAG: 50S ribosomal protein L25 [Planctomycetota bacterium]
MPETVVLKAGIREQSGTKSSVALRQQGKLPAVVYGHKKEPVSITLDEREFLDSLHHGNRIFDIDLAGAKDTLLVKDIQYDYLGDTVIHADLMRVDLNERVKVEVMIKLVGTAAGTHMGGIIEEIMNRIEVECAVRDIPEFLPVDIKGLELDKTLRAAEIELPAGFVLVTDPNAGVIGCHEPKAIVAEEDAAEAAEGAEVAEGATEPEVITEKKEEEESSK